MSGVHSKVTVIQKPMTSIKTTIHIHTKNPFSTDQIKNNTSYRKLVHTHSHAWEKEIETAIATKTLTNHTMK